MSNFAAKVQSSRSELIYFVTLKEATTGQDAWYYVQLESKAKAPVFLEKVKTGITLTDYGKILYSGWGCTAPEDIKQKITEQFG